MPLTIVIINADTDVIAEKVAENEEAVTVLMMQQLPVTLYTNSGCICVWWTHLAVSSIGDEFFARPSNKHRRTMTVKHH